MSVDLATMAPVAEKLYRALRLMPCTCVNNVRYEGAKAIQERKCGRCQAVEEYEELTGVKVEAAS